MRRLVAAAVSVLLVASMFGRAAGQSRETITVDDLMALRSIVDVQISPDGDRVAYVVSTPDLPKYEHTAALFLVPSAGGPPKRIGETVRIFNIPSPRPQLRWLPNGAGVSVLGLASGRPQV